MTVVRNVPHIYVHRNYQYLYNHAIFTMWQYGDHIMYIHSSAQSLRWKPIFRTKKSVCTWLTEQPLSQWMMAIIIRDEIFLNKNDLHATGASSSQLSSAIRTFSASAKKTDFLPCFSFTLHCLPGLQSKVARGKSLLESWVTNFLPYWQLPLIFVRYISNFLYMCSNSVDSVHVILK